MPAEPAPSVSEPAPVVLAPIDDGRAPAPPVQDDNVPRFIEPKGKPKGAPAKTGKSPREARRDARPAQPKAKPQRKEHYTLIAVVSAIRSLIVTFAAAVIVSTIF